MVKFAPTTTLVIGVTAACRRRCVWSMSSLGHMNSLILAVAMVVRTDDVHQAGYILVRSEPDVGLVVELLEEVVAFHVGQQDGEHADVGPVAGHWDRPAVSRHADRSSPAAASAKSVW